MKAYFENHWKTANKYYCINLLPSLWVVIDKQNTEELVSSTGTVLNIPHITYGIGLDWLGFQVDVEWTKYL